METKLNRPSRFWHEDNETESIDQVHKPGLETRLIDQVDKPDSSTKSINQVLNLVDKPGFKKQVYRPGLMSLEKLRGNPLRVIRFLYSSIENFDEKVTRKIQLIEVMQVLELTRDSARTGIKFLTKNNLIITVDYLNGLYGWTRYKITDSIFNEIWSIDQVHKPGVKPGLLDSNSNKNIITIGEGWDEIDFSSLEPIGFRKNHLLQIKKFTTPAITQESVNHFAFALENNEKVRKYETPLNVLITVLKRGEAWVEVNYESPLERAQRLQLERRRAEQNRFQKREEELRNLEFNHWEKSLDEDQKRRISPRGFIGEMKVYFYENVWPEIKKNLEK